MKNIIYKPTNYPSDVTDEEWKIIKPLIPVGNKSNWHKRSLVNAVYYIDKTGCQWRYLPHDYPPHDTVWSFFRRARDSGLWERINEALVKETRLKAGRGESPTYGIIDSQSVKTIGAGEGRGIDGGKKIKGRKRHIMVDIMGNLLAAVVHAANINDTKGGMEVASRAFDKYPTIERFCGDEGYRGTFVDYIDWEFDLGVDIFERVTSKFVLLPKRWVVERTFAWLGNYRRLSKDYEITIESAEPFVMISHSRVLLRRLC